MTRVLVVCFDGVRHYLHSPAPSAWALAQRYTAARDGTRKIGAEIAYEMGGTLLHSTPSEATILVDRSTPSTRLVRNVSAKSGAEAALEEVSSQLWKVRSTWPLWNETIGSIRSSESGIWERPIAEIAAIANAPILWYRGDVVGTRRYLHAGGSLISRAKELASSFARVADEFVATQNLLLLNCVSDDLVALGTVASLARLDTGLREALPHGLRLRWGFAPVASNADLSDVPHRIHAALRGNSRNDGIRVGDAPFV